MEGRSQCYPLQKISQVIEDPGRGKLWKSPDKWQIQSEEEISIEHRGKFATAIRLTSRHVVE